MISSRETRLSASFRRGNRAIAIAGLLVFASGSAWGQLAVQECGSLEHMRADPFDYTDPSNRDHLSTVEYAHFTAEVAQLLGHQKCGGNRCGLANDIDYTLRNFPNHHRALHSMANYHLQGYDKTLGAMRFTARCYFVRALRFKPKDPVVRMLYGHYLSRIDQPDAALAKYKEALALVPNSSEAHYNIALLYVDREEYPLAREHAHKAYSLGFPLPGLRARLERAGQWEVPDSGATDQQE